MRCSSIRRPYNIFPNLSDIYKLTKKKETDMLLNYTSPSLSYRLNPFPSDSNFKKSCETIFTKTKRLEVRVLNRILSHDDSTKPLIDDDKHIYIWYLAIGSMINPISLHLRDLTPLISYPAKCPNHRLVFRDPSGMADIQLCDGEEFHGVVHLLSIEQMIRLDQVEHMYKRITVKIIDYQQRSHIVYVYKMSLIDQQERPIGIPSERYLDIIVKGCEYFDVDSSYINYLKHEQPVIPRKSPDAYQTVKNIPDNVYYTMEDLLKHDGKNSMLPLWISINGKILEYKGLPSDNHPDYENQKRFYDFIVSYLSGKESAHIISRAWYEPMYKLPLNEEDLCHEHRALAEDLFISWSIQDNDENKESYWIPIGRILHTENTNQSE